MRWRTYDEPALARGAVARDGVWDLVERHKVTTIVVAMAAFVALGNWGEGDRSDAGSDAPTEHSVHPEEPPAPPYGDADREPRQQRRGEARPARADVPTFRVVRVVDGDTLELGNGETVRIVGIDAPESGECGHARATRRLAALVEGRRVMLGNSDDDRDPYGRLLRYVDRGRVDAGLRLIRDGLANARYDSRDGYGEHPRERAYIRADRQSPDVTCAPPRAIAEAPVPARCAAGYQPCVRPAPPDLDCADLDGPIRVTGRDPHRLDADGDGIACE